MSFKEKLKDTNARIKNKAIDVAENVVGSYEENPFLVARNSFYKLKAFINIILTLSLFTLSTISSILTSLYHFLYFYYQVIFLLN